MSDNNNNSNYENSHKTRKYKRKSKKNKVNNNNGYSSNVGKKKLEKEKKQKELNDFKSSLPSSLPARPDWYLIHEIDIRDFLFCVKRLFTLIEDDIQKEPLYDDIFAKQIYLSQTGSNEQGWIQFNNTLRLQNGLYQRLGDFHEELAGKFHGFRTLHTGHHSGVDVIREDKQIFMEWKNSTSFNKKDVFTKFKKILDNKEYPSTSIVVLVCVNVPERWTKPKAIYQSKYKKDTIDLTPYGERVKIMSGREAYAALSNSESFFERLVTTIGNVFKNKNIMDFIQTIEMSMDIES